MDERKISAVNLKKTYISTEKTGFLKPRKKKNVEAVKGISLEIPRGKIIGLLGVNGAGKTTMIRMLSAMVEPTAGSLHIDGVDAIKHHMEVKSKLNMIAGGERNLFWRLTAVENLSYFGRLYGLSGKPLAERIDTLLAMVGLTEAANTPVERYSKGMKQRLQIARGLINDPDYLFLDEPTLGLDIIIAKEIKAYISGLAASQDKGVLLTTHYISEAEELCDYIYVIDAGTIIASGTKEDLKNLLAYKAELEVETLPLPADVKEKLEGIAAGIPNTKISFAPASEDGKSERISVIGDESFWPVLIDTLSAAKQPILHIRNKEPDLADVLFSIIQSSRQGAEGAL